MLIYLYIIFLFNKIHNQQTIIYLQNMSYIKKMYIDLIYLKIKNNNNFKELVLN